MGFSKYSAYIQYFVDKGYLRIIDKSNLDLEPTLTCEVVREYQIETTDEEIIRKINSLRAV